MQPSGWEHIATPTREDVHQIRFVVQESKVKWGCVCNNIPLKQVEGRDVMEILTEWRRHGENAPEGDSQDV